MASSSSERITAGDRAFEERVQREAQQLHSRFRYHSIELPDGTILPGMQSIDHLRWRLGLFGLPHDLSGKRVLDVGAWDGWFSFECERRGAEVVAVDCIRLDTFLEAKERIGSKVEYLTLDVNELSAARLGTFDIVLFLGVLYHLRHPLLGLEKAVELSTDLVLVESFVIASEKRQIPAVMEFYERTELGGQLDNWCGPTLECLVAMCRSAGLAQVNVIDMTNQRASLVCKRRWPLPDREPSVAAPQLRAAINSRTYRSSFHPLKDEYLSCYFKSAEPGLTADSVFVEVDGFDVRTLVLSASEGDGYQANCLRPPGLRPGRHEVRVRTKSSTWSNPVTFAMLDESGREIVTLSADLPAEAPELCSVELKPSDDQRFAVNRGGSLICYFRSRAESVGAADVSLEMGERVARADTVSWLGDNVWQANLLLDQPLPRGMVVRLRLGIGEWSLALQVTGAV